jgi:hypothetical protein
MWIFILLFFPKIGYMTHSMEGFFFATEMDLDIGYHLIKLDIDAQKLCTMGLPWHIGKYKYKRLPMGIKIPWFLMCLIPCLNLLQVWNNLSKTRFTDDLSILTNGIAQLQRP